MTPPGSKPFGFKVSMIFRDADEAEHFLRGIIIARTNNSSPKLVELIDALNAGLQESRAQALNDTMSARAEAGMP